MPRSAASTNLKLLTITAPSLYRSSNCTLHDATRPSEDPEILETLSPGRGRCAPWIAHITVSINFVESIPWQCLDTKTIALFNVWYSIKMPIHIHLLVSTCIYSTCTFLLWWQSDNSKLLERRDFGYFALPFACNFGYTSLCSAVNDLQPDLPPQFTANVSS